MRIALIAPPFIPVPPRRYGGTELFLANLAKALQMRGHEVVVYANGESRSPAEVRWLYAASHWPLTGELSETLKQINHTAWAIEDARKSCDVVHTNDVYGLPYTRFIDTPFVHTVHHAHDPAISELYAHYPDVHYVTISDFQRRKESMPLRRTIHHGIDLSCYPLQEKKGSYLSFLGRLSPIKGAHLAIEIAKKAGIPLKIAGEVQPIDRDYFVAEIKPHIDGKWIEYIGEADLALKNELLGNSMAFLFPILWDEPFGLVTIEAMACGTPVLALARGSVREIVGDGLNGYVCESVDELVAHARDAERWSRPEVTRRWVERYFSMEQMAAEYELLYREISTPAPVSPEIDLSMSQEPTIP